MSYVLGLTGPTGSGKSTACKYARDNGWKIIDCDSLARDAVKIPEALMALACAFGEDILNGDKTLDRKALAQKAFCNEDKTELLNKTLLPFIVELIKVEIKQAKSEKIILDAPTLYESGADSICDAVCVITAPQDVRKDRIIKRDNIDDAAAMLRIGAGKNDEYYKQRAAHIIYNDSSEEKLINDFAQILDTLGGR